MNLRRAFWILAAIIAGYGSLLLFGTAALVIAAVVETARPPHLPGLIFALIFAAQLLFAVIFLRTAVRYFRMPGQNSARALGANTAVLIWFELASILKHHEPTGPAGGLGVGLGAVAAAWLCYLLILRPAALRAFPAG